MGKFYSWARWYTARGQSEENPAEFIVGYVSDTKKLSEVPAAVTFSVSQKYDVELQKKRAEDYATYLNKLDEAAKVAYDQIHLVDILKR
jgi:hypothetical protein